MDPNIPTSRNRELTDAIQSMTLLFGKGSSSDIQQYLLVVMNEIAIHNAASPDNEQVWAEMWKYSA